MSKANPAGDAVIASAAPTVEDVPTVPTVQPDGQPSPVDVVAANEDGINRIVNLVAATLDPTDAMAKYSAIGRECLAHLRRQKASVPGKWVKSDYDRFCSRVADEVKLRVAVDKVEVSVYVRVHLFCELVAVHAPAVNTLSYYTVKQFGIPTIEFDPVELSASIKPDWTPFVVNLVATQTSDKPMTTPMVRESVADHAKSIQDAKLGKMSPEKQAEAVAKAKDAKIRAEKKKHRDAIDVAIRAALEEKALSPLDVAQQVDAIARDTINASLPAVGAFNPTTASANDCIALAQGLFAAGKIAEIKVLHTVLGKMMEAVASAAAAKTGTEKPALAVA